MSIHHQQFGRDWTDRKLSCLKKYLEAYNQALKNQHFYRVYIDAFAGSGFRINKDFQYFEKQEILDMNSYSVGSAKISLDIEPGFNEYFFIEKEQHNIRGLIDLRGKYPSKKIKIIEGDANNEVKKICRSIKWKNKRGVGFLDPFGMQVEWNTLEDIAETESLDCWVLVPIGVAINRLLTIDKEPPESWQISITKVLGTEDWKSVFYKKDPQLSLFPEKYKNRVIKVASFNKIGQFFLKRMNEIFPGVINKPFYLYNSKNNPLYALCFGVSNPSKKAQVLALKLATEIIGKEQDCG